MIVCKNLFKEVEKMNEKELLLQAKLGDVLAFEKLIEQHQKIIFSIAYRIAGNQEDAADMTQEVLIKIFKNLKKFKEKSKFSTWVYRVATNTCLDEAKKQRNKAAYSLDAEFLTEEGSYLSEIPDTGITPEQAYQKKEVMNAVNVAISYLSDEHKKVIILRDIQGFSYQDIAEILKCSEGTVKSRISRARDQLKKILLQDRELFSEYFVK